MGGRGKTMMWDILPMVQRHDDAYIIRIFDGTRDKFGLTNCTRVGILACDIRDFAVPIYSLILNDGYHTCVDTAFISQIDRCSVLFITFDPKNISKIRSNAESLGLICTEPVHFNPKNSFEEIIRYPIKYFPSLL